MILTFQTTRCSIEKHNKLLEGRRRNVWSKKGFYTRGISAI